MGRLVFLGVAVLLSLALVAFGWWGYPLPGGDAVAFIPPVLSQLKGLGFTNHVYEVAHWADPTGADRFVYYVPFFQMVLSAMAWMSTPQCVLACIGILNGCTLLLYAWVYCRVIPQIVCRSSILLGVTSLTGLATLFTYHADGRPESLVTLLMMGLLCISLRWPQQRWLAILQGGLIGLMGATQPTATLLVALLLGMVWSYQRGYRMSLMVALQITLAALVSFAVVLLCSGLPPEAILKGTLAHGAYEVSVHAKTQWSAILQYYVLKKRMMFYGALVLVNLIYWAKWLWQKRSAPQSPILFWLCLLLWLGLVWNTSVRSSNNNYNLMTLAPLMVLTVCYGVNTLSGKWQKAFRAGAIVVMLLISVGWAKTALNSWVYHQHGVSLHQARVLLRQQLAAFPPSVPLGVSRSLWLLSEDYSRMFVWEGPQVKQAIPADKLSRAVLVLQQNYSADTDSPPPPPPGHRLRYHCFVPRLQHPFWRRLSSSVPGYQFAVYEPVVYAP